MAKKKMTICCLFGLTFLWTEYFWILHCHFDGLFTYLFSDFNLQLKFNHKCCYSDKKNREQFLYI